MKNALLNAGSIVKSIQKGALVVKSVSDSPTSADISISTVAPEKCFVIIESNIGVGSASKFWTESRLKEISENKLTIMIRSCGTVSGYTHDCQVSWQVIEFY